MAVEALKCKECGELYALEARYVCDACFGPLEVAYDLSGLDAEELRRKIQSGPLSIWRYADFLPFETPPQPDQRRHACAQGRLRARLERDEHGGAPYPGRAPLDPPAQLPPLQAPEGGGGPAR